MNLRRVELGTILASAGSLFFPKVFCKSADIIIIRFNKQGDKMENELSPKDLLIRINQDLDLLAQSAALFGRGSELDIKEAQRRMAEVLKDLNNQ